MTMDFVWMIIVVVLMAVLPDLLRRKRKYPRSKGPIPVPPRRKPAPKIEEPEPSFPEWEDLADEFDLPDEPQPMPQRAAASPRAAEAPLRSVPVVVPQRVRPRPWSQLTPPARELYAGFVWPEIWQEPLAHRKGFIKKERGFNHK